MCPAAALLITVPFSEKNICSKHVVNAVTVSINISWNAYKLTIFTRDSIYAIARICHGNSVRLSVCLSVRHTGGSVKNG